MLRFSKKVEYALIAMLHMAQEGENDLITAKELSDQYNIPLELMGKVLQSLVKNELIMSIQGVKGGYKLNQSIENINITNVVKAVDGPFKIVKCIEHQNTLSCGQLHFCSIKNPMEIIQNKLEHIFRSISLKDLEKDMIDVNETF